MTTWDTDLPWGLNRSLAAAGLPPDQVLFVTLIDELIQPVEIHVGEKIDPLR